MKDLSIKVKILLIVLGSIIIVTISLSVQSVSTIKKMTNQNIAQYEKQVMDAKKESIKNYVDMARGILQTYRDKVTVDSTKEELEQIKNDALKALDSMRYGEDGYVFVWNYDGVALANYLRPDLIGIVHLDMKGGGGQWIIRDLIANAKEGGGSFYCFQWRLTKESPYKSRISYSFGLQDWEWFVGAGEYMEKEEAQIEAKKEQLLEQTEALIKNIITNALVIILIIGFILYFINQQIIYKPIKKLEKGLNDFFLFLQNKTTKVERIDIDSNDEFGKMAKSINENIKVSTRLHQEIKELNSNLENKIKIRTEELIIAKVKAEELTKTKSEFLANMSHEIRTPMNGILGMSHLVLQNDLNDKQRHYVQKIDSSAKSLLGIINDILDFSKIEAGKLTIEKVDFDLFKVIDGVINLIECKAHEKNLELIVKYGVNIGKNFYGDSLRIAQVLTNLIGNSVKFTEAGEIGIYINKVNDKRVRFEVKDTGIGLTAKQQKKLFQPFSQADGSTTRKYGGSGLGLTISKQLVELMDGKIWVESQIGVGSSFLFEICIEDRDNVTSKFTIFSDKKVLIVDDNEAWRDILSTLLRTFGMQVDLAISGANALEILQGAESKYDLILMDWNMPGLDGVETTKLINEKYSKKNLPTVIMVSAFRQESLKQLAKDVNIDILLTKPINPSVLNDVLCNLFIDGHESHYIQHEEKSLKDDIRSLKGSRILLTEDNEINQDIVLGLLEDSGIEIDIANDGVEGVDKYKANPNKYDLILMDMQMPNMDGVTASEIIRKENKDIPIIALTANAMTADIEKTKKAGMNEHLNKPLEVEKLYETLLKYITKKNVNNKGLNVKKDEVEIPVFECIDTIKGLDHVAGNKKLYLRILNNFKNEYKEISLDNLDVDEFKRKTHTLKGLTATIGAKSLYTIVEELDDTGNKELLPKFYKELNIVIDELKEKLVDEIGEVKVKKEISVKLRDELFDTLKHAAQAKKPKECESIILELEKYNLSDKHNKLFEDIKKLIKKYRFKEVVNLL